MLAANTYARFLPRHPASKSRQAGSRMSGRRGAGVPLTTHAIHTRNSKAADRLPANKTDTVSSRASNPRLARRKIESSA